MLLPNRLPWILSSLIYGICVYNVDAKITVPPSSNIVTVKAFNGVTPNPSNSGPASTLVFPIVPGKENFDGDFMAFLVENPKKNVKVMFDIGIRKDVENLAPAAAQLFTSGTFKLDIEEDIPTQLTKGNVSLNSISAVIWSHSHFDHIGDMTLWPNTTRLVIGSETNMTTFPTDPNALIQASDFAGHEIQKVFFNNTKLEIGGFPAVDFFGDGSFFLLDVPGHIAGHMAALARVSTSPESFILLAGDAFHQAGQIRPSFHLHDTFPVPQDILTSSRKNIARKFFFAPDDNTDLHNHTQPFLSVPTGAESFYQDPVTARVSQFMVTVFDSDPDVLVLSSHDPTMHDFLDFFPQTLNGWKRANIKNRGVWNFANITARGYRLS